MYKDEYSLCNNTLFIIKIQILFFIHRKSYNFKI